MKKLAVALLLSVAFCSSALAEECTSKLQGFLNKTGYKLTVAKPCQVWAATDALAIPKGDGLTGLLLIGQEGDMAVVGTVVQTKAKLSADRLVELMKLNNQFEFVKVGIDNDGDLFVRAELHMGSITASEFATVLKSVVEASAKTYDVVKK